MGIKFFPNSGWAILGAVTKQPDLRCYMERTFLRNLRDHRRAKFKIRTMIRFRLGACGGIPSEHREISSCGAANDVYSLASTFITRD